MKSSGESSPRPRVSTVNRKYLGSKRELADAIAEKIVATSGLPEVFFDGFLGTGAVSAALLARGVRRIVACDTLLSNTVVFRGSFALSAKKSAGLEATAAELNGLGGTVGYITRHFAGRYFTRANCLLMDAVREEIERRKNTGEIDDEVHAALLAGFILGADRVANTVGQYDAYLKHIGRRGIENGRHLVDTRVYDRFRLPLIEPLPAVRRTILNADVTAVAGATEADTAYFDPPYNHRQYCDNYHVLENLARWEKPPLAGKTRKFDRAGLKSDFSSRRKAGSALSGLLGKVRARHVYLSYNSEGILSRGELERIIGPERLAARWDIPYPVFGRGAGVSRKRTVIEHLFYIRNDLF